MGELLLPEGYGQLAAPAAAVEHKQRREHTLIPAVFQRADWAEICKAHDVGPMSTFFIEPEKCGLTQRSHARVMHVMAKSAEQVLCQCGAPDGYPILHGLSQSENQALLTTQTLAASWHRMTWCGACTAWAGLLVSKPAA